MSDANPRAGLTVEHRGKCASCRKCTVNRLKIPLDHDNGKPKSYAELQQEETAFMSLPVYHLKCQPTSHV